MPWRRFVGAARPGRCARSRSSGTPGRSGRAAQTAPVVISTIQIDERAVLAQAQHLGGDHAPVHAGAPSREVTSRKRSSSETRAGSIRCTAMPASTSRRLMSAIAASEPSAEDEPQRRPRPRPTRPPRGGRAAAARPRGRVVHADRDRRLAAGGHLGDRALHEDAAAVDDRGHVADLLDLVQQVGGEEDGAALVDQRARTRGTR